MSINLFCNKANSQQLAAVASRQKKQYNPVLHVGEMAAGAGLAMAAGAVKPAPTPTTDPATDPAEGALLTNEASVAAVVYEGVPVASQVTDAMSFSDAFASARTEVGAGGIFEWHGKLYNTFYAAEWGQMSPEQKAEFGESVDQTSLHEVSPESAGITGAISGSNTPIDTRTEAVHAAIYPVATEPINIDGYAGQLTIYSDGTQQAVFDVNGDGSNDVTAVINGSGQVVFYDNDGNIISDNDTQAGQQNSNTPGPADASAHEDNNGMHHDPGFNDFNGEFDNNANMEEWER